MRKFWKIFVLFTAMTSPSLASAVPELKTYSFNGMEYNLRVEDKDWNKGDSFNWAVEQLKEAFEGYPFIKGKMESCSTVIDMPVGTKNGNHSFGGICTLRHDSEAIKFMICTDEMIGHDALKFGGMFSEERLAKFVVLNCYGG